MNTLTSMMIFGIMISLSIWYLADPATMAIMCDFICELFKQWSIVL